MANRGPKTAAGRAAVSKNAVKYGIHSESPVIQGLESEEDWQEHLQGILESLLPEGRLESELAERIALLLWRLRRVARYERDVIDVSQQRISEEWAYGRSIRAGEAVEWAEEAHQVLADVPLDQQDTSAESAIDALVPVLQTYGSVWLDQADESYDEADWPEFRIREYLRALSDESSDVEGLRRNLAAWLKTVITRRQARSEATSLELRHISREGLLPSDREVSKVTRYEAHLHRQLLQTMHELEALQGRRLGAITPLARLDVTESPASEG